MIKVSDVSVVSEGVTLLPPTSLRVGAGEALVVRGHNGAGKSTLLKVIAGSRPPSAGTVTVGGAPVLKRSQEFRRRVATMVGLPPMATDLTVRDHVRLIASTWLDDPAETARASEGVLQSLGLVSLQLRFPHELSTGQLQLAGLALVLVRPFDVLLLDEPEQRLDPDRIATVGEVLARRRDDGASIVVATHSQSLAERLGDSVLDLGTVR